MTKTRRVLKGRALVGLIALVLAVGIIVAVVASGGSDAPATSPTTASSSTDVGATAAAPSSQPSQTTPGIIIVTVVGTINEMLPAGDFVINDGHTDYTIAMSSAPTIVDVNGKAETSDLIQLGISVQITGTLIGSTINAQTVIVPTRPVTPPTDP